jgi:S1-C subfamily serine protease
MYLASSSANDIVQFGRIVGYILFLGVLPAAIIVFLVTGFRLISRRSPQRIGLFISSGFASVALLIPIALVVRGVLTSRSFGTVKQLPTSDSHRGPMPQKPAKTITTPMPQHDIWFEFTGIKTSDKHSTVSATEIYKQFAPVVVTIVTEPANSISSREEKSMQGTGVIFRRPPEPGKTEYWLLTCYHVMSGMKGQFNLLNSKDHSISALAGTAIVDEENDWCLVPLTLSSNNDFDSLPVLHMIDALPDVGEDMFAIGTPEGMDLTLSKGIVSSIRIVPQGSWIQTTCPISSGSSGSPAFNSNGSFLGIAVESVKEGQNINFLVSAQTMRRRINEGNLSRISFPNSTLLDFLSICRTESIKRASVEGIRTEVQYDTGYDALSTPQGERFRLLFGDNKIRNVAPSSDHINDGVRNASDYPLSVVKDARGLIWQHPVGLGNVVFVCKQEVDGDRLILTYESDSPISKSKGTLTIDIKSSSFVEEVEESMPPINGVSVRRFVGKGKITSISIND